MRFDCHRYRLILWLESRRFCSCKSKSSATSHGGSEKSKYSQTVLLPKSSFPMRHSRKLELNVEKDDSFANFYHNQLQTNADKTIVIHDGPPYANGPAHIGHAINKILKDMIMRRKALEKNRVLFVPGWDCHGLPIELKAIKDMQKNEHSPLKIRQTAKKFAMAAVEGQKKTFIKWGVKSDWNHPYLTSDLDYVINQLRIFHRLYSDSFVFRDKMPVYWSPSTQTALAEAELQYDDQHTSPSVYVKMKFVNVPPCLSDFKNLHAIIWTTTPWTLPANQAIAFAANQNYCVVKISKFPADNFIIAEHLVPTLASTLNSPIDIKLSFKGVEMKTATYSNPIGLSNDELPFIEGQHVSMSKGTGLVHTAPNHGVEDYKLCLQNQIALADNLVDENGCYNNKAGTTLSGKDVLTDGNKKILELLGANLLHHSEYVHSYPYDWRSNKPVLTIASQQWFINMDLLREPCIKALDSVNFRPEFGKEIIKKQLEARPHWCISRQRSWGVPIPVFYKKSDVHKTQPIMNSTIFEELLNSFKKFGIDSWWSMPVEQLVSCQLNEELIPGKDIFDIWFDSGTSWSQVLPEPKIADIYIEGMDQLRGWFQSSLILSVALRGTAPYKNVLIHGFALDANGKKMSKSIGNVVDPIDLIEGNKNLDFPSVGIDGLRLWIALNGSSHGNCNVSKESFEATLATLNKIRNIFKFIMGSIKEFENPNNFCHLDELCVLDRYALHLLNQFDLSIDKQYEEFNIDQVSRTILDFLYNTVSAFYLSRVKDRLYCDERFSISRRSCQTVLFYIYNSLVHCLYPIVPHLIHEAQNHLRFCDIDDTKKKLWENKALAKTMQLHMSIVKTIAKGCVGKNLVEHDLYIKCNHKNLELQLKELTNNDDLCEIFQTSQVFVFNEMPQLEGTILKPQEVFESENPEDPENLLNQYDADLLNYELLITPASKCLCPRCRRFIVDQVNCLCERCTKVLSQSTASENAASV